MYVGQQVWVVQEGPFPGNRESDKKVHRCSVLLTTDGTQLTLRLAEICEVKNMNFHTYLSYRSQYTQNQLHSSGRNLGLITDRSK
jgi:hypothetical protein